MYINNVGSIYNIKSFYNISIHKSDNNKENFHVRT
jgi:hypothetical protein